MTAFYSPFLPIYRRQRAARAAALTVWPGAVSTGNRATLNTQRLASFLVSGRAAPVATVVFLDRPICRGAGDFAEVRAGGGDRGAPLPRIVPSAISPAPRAMITPFRSPVAYCARRRSYSLGPQQGLQLVLGSFDLREASFELPLCRAGSPHASPLRLRLPPPLEHAGDVGNRLTGPGCPCLLDRLQFMPSWPNSSIHFRGSAALLLPR